MKRIHFSPKSKLSLKTWLFLKFKVVSRTSLFLTTWINIYEEKCTDMPHTKNSTHTGPRSLDQKGKTCSIITRLKHATVQVLVQKIREKTLTRKQLRVRNARSYYKRTLSRGKTVHRYNLSG